MALTESAGPLESFLDHQLGDYFPIMGQFSSLARLEKSLVYRSLKPAIEKLMSGIEYGFYAPAPPASAPTSKKHFTAVAWNLERGICFEGILYHLKNHPRLKDADLYFLTETDVGMARSANRNVARELARELELNYVFAPCYLNLCKGNEAEGHYEGENTMALHGNALLSRYPLTNLRSIPLRNCRDKMRGGEKRLGCQKAVLADVAMPGLRLTAAVAHLDAFSSHRQRADQMESIITALGLSPHPVLLGGDFNTSGYDSRNAFYAVVGFINKLLRGMGDIIANHAGYPFKYFDRFVFEVLERAGFDYQSLNEPGVGTFVYCVDDLKGNQIVTDVVPGWCRDAFIRIFKKFGGRVALKLDWFAGRKVRPALETGGPPLVIHDLEYDDKPVSDHAAIRLDFVRHEA